MGKDQQRRIVVADDHPLFREALVQAIAPILEGADITHAGALDEVTAALQTDPDPELVLLDLSMPGVRGYSGLIYLRAQFPAIPLLVVSASEEPAVIRRCIDLGASGFIPKSMKPERMREAVQSVLNGGIWIPDDITLDAEDETEEAELARRLATLTPQQVRVLMMLSEGLLNKQIAYEISVSEATVKA
ncbi:MAG: response regulator transcription factor, partial [Pseudomonadota bacterium]